jgi:Protein of unknown function (DUF2855)
VIVKAILTLKSEIGELQMAETIWANIADLTDLTVNEEALPLLGDGEIRLRIESFSVTANNVTYAVIGNQFGYWNFFPAQEGFGIVPVWGHAIVEQSRCDDIAIGERVYGYLPMGTHLDALPANISASGFSDSAAHRLPMSPIYNQYSRLSADPEHDPLRENQRMLFAPLFKTGFLIEDMFRRNDWFGAQNLVMTSASSKTAMALASCAKNASPQIKRTGLTSAGNLAFSKGTGLYDEVFEYADIANLPNSPSVSVDFAGSSAILLSVHEALGDALKYSCLVGVTHVNERGSGDPLPGPAPILFFAPDHAVAAVKEIGPKAFGEAVAVQWRNFLDAVDGSLTIDVREGVVAAAGAFLATFKGEVDPATGIIIKP